MILRAAPRPNCFEYPSIPVNGPHILRQTVLVHAANHAPPEALAKERPGLRMSQPDVSITKRLVRPWTCGRIESIIFGPPLVVGASHVDRLRFESTKPVRGYAGLRYDLAPGRSISLLDPSVTYFQIGAIEFRCHCLRRWLCAVAGCRRHGRVRRGPHWVSCARGQGSQYGIRIKSGRLHLVRPQESKGAGMQPLLVDVARCRNGWIALPASQHQLPEPGMSECTRDGASNTDCGHSRNACPDGT